MILSNIKKYSEIKHFAVGYAKTEAEQEWYLCNQKVKPNFDKMVHFKEKVTCKNCLRILERMGR